MDLSPEEVRVLGCLIEKALTTPQQYPLTLNALTLACNQSSNREPVVSYDERTVEAAVTSAKTWGLARFVHPSHGRSALRYAHTLDSVLGLDERQIALVAVMMLRGPQTPGELRARTERMAKFSGLGEMEEELRSLVSREEPVVVRLGRMPGQKEERYAHLLGGLAVDGDGSANAASAPAPRPVAEASAGGLLVSGQVDLAAQVAALRVEVDTLRRDLDQLRSMWES